MQFIVISPREDRYIGPYPADRLGDLAKRVLPGSYENSPELHNAIRAWANKANNGDVLTLPGMDYAVIAIAIRDEPPTMTRLKIRRKPIAQMVRIEPRTIEEEAEETYEEEEDDEAYDEEDEDDDEDDVRRKYKKR